MINKLKKELKKLANPQKAATLQRFFKTAPGQYGEGDIFLGTTVPQLRMLSKSFPNLPLAEIELLLTSDIHEERLLALFILIKQFQKGDISQKEKIFNFYLQHLKHINNWDLIDSSCEYILGAYLNDKPKGLLLKFAKSNDLWQKRIAIISTFHYIKKGDADLTMQIATILLHDKHDLIHKAVGWMLREVSNRCSKETLINFLDEHASTMPRTMLRYAIEKFSAEERQHYLKLKA